MRKHRFVSMIITAAVAVMIPIIASSPALAAGPDGSASEAERLGCQSSDYTQIGTWSLRYNGEAHPEIGHVKVLVRPSPSNPDNTRVCAITYHGSNIWGNLRYTSIEVGSEPLGNGVQDIYFWDTADYRYYTEGRAITPGSSRCAVIHGAIKSADGTKTYQVWIDQNDVADRYFCN